MRPLRSAGVAGLVALFLTALAVGDAGPRPVTFSREQVGRLPPDWKAARTGEGEGSVWKVVADDTAPGSRRSALSPATAQTTRPSAKSNHGSLAPMCAGPASLGSARETSSGRARRAAASSIRHGWYRILPEARAVAKSQDDARYQDDVDDRATQPTARLP